MDLVGAIDIGATKALVTVRPLPLDEWRVGGPSRRIPSMRNPTAFADALAGALRDLAGEAGGSLVAVGCGTPGPLDRQTGVIVRSPNQGWEMVPLGPMLEARLDVPARLEDDSNTGGLGESAMGAGRGADPCVYVALGTGLGTGIVIGGEVLHGVHAAAGELGHLVVFPGGLRCGCRHRGCVEVYAAGAGLQAQIADAWPRGRAIGGSAAAAPANPTELFAMARRGDPRASAIVEQGVEALARCFGAIEAAFDPERIVVGGSIGVGQRLYVRKAATRARVYCIAEAGSSMQVVGAALGNESVLAGAAVLAARAAVRVPPGARGAAATRATRQS
jgi:glucokinase